MAQILDEHHGHPLAGLLWERQFEEILSHLGWEKVRYWECLFVHRKQVLFKKVYVDIKMAGKKQNMGPMWKKLMKNVDLDEPTSFLDRVYLGCTQLECEPNETIIKPYRGMFESRMSAGATQKLPGCEKPYAKKELRGPMTWKDMLTNALREIPNWQIKRQSSYIKLPVLAWMNIISRRKNWNQLENDQKYTHRLS